MEISRPPVRSAPFTRPLVSSTTEQEGYHNTRRTGVDPLDTSATQLSDVDPSPTTHNEPKRSQAPVVPPTGTEDQHLNAIEPVKHAAGGGFDYGNLDPDDVLAAEGAATRIFSLSGCEAQAVLEIGDILSVEKIRLGHGKFIKWLKAKFGWSLRTAQRYMQLAEVLKGKNDIVSLLPLTTLHRLVAASTPANLRDDILARVAAMELTPAAVSALLDEKRAEARKGKEARASKPGKSSAPDRVTDNSQDSPPAGLEGTLGEPSTEALNAAAEAARLIANAVGPALDQLIALLKSADPQELIRRTLADIADRQTLGVSHDVDASSASDAPALAEDHAG